MSMDSPVVETRNGPVRGTKRISIFGDEFISFHQIPYAEPPIGNQRFKDPVPITSWTDIVNGVEEGPTPYGTNVWLGGITGDEDCLHINIYTKDLNRSKKVPVMVWFYGGGFYYGSTSEKLYSPDYLLQKEIVFVSVNYRLGAFGFLSIKEERFGIPGNAGLKDQSLALKWIRSNIDRFGGDPRNITAFGESAGGASVEYHMISPMSTNLFDKGILMSGTVLNNWATVPDINNVERLAVALGWNEEGGIDRAFEIIQKAKAIDIVKAQDWILSPTEKRNCVLFSFGPVIEPYVSEQCFISGPIIEMVRQGWGTNIPIMIGYTSEEGLFCFREAIDDPKLLRNLGDFEQFVPLELNHLDSANRSEHGLSLKRHYFGNDEPSTDRIYDYVNLMSDKLFIHGIYRTIWSRLDRNAAPTFVYRFNFDSNEFNHYRINIAGKETRGSSHVDDLSYLFKNKFVKDVIVNSKEHKTIQIMVKIWTTFAASSNPNNKYTKQLSWQPVTDINDLRLLNISDELSVVNFPELKRMELWNTFYQEDQLI